MKPSSDQISSLQKYLRKNLKYRETYAEFYDHILTAIESEIADASFNDQVMKVVKEDFGGVEGMRSIEYEYQRMCFKELKKKYLHYAVDNFRLPGIFITAAFWVLIYFMVKQSWFDMDMFLLNIFVIRIIPNILGMINRIRSPRFYGAPGRSIKDVFFRWQNFIPAIIFFIGYSLTTHGAFTGQAWMHRLTPTPLISTILILLMALHSLTYYKVYRDDIKTGLKLT